MLWVITSFLLHLVLIFYLFFFHFFYFLVLISDKNLVLGVSILFFLSFSFFIFRLVCCTLIRLYYSGSGAVILFMVRVRGIV